MVAARSRMALFVFGWGFYALVVQSVLLRETMVLFFGGELSWALVLSSWLLGITIGAMGGARLARLVRRPAPVLGVVALVFAVLVPLAILVLRSCRICLAIGPGELVPIGSTAALAMATVGPCGAMIGLSFPLIVAVIRAAPGAAARQIGWVYLVESAGSLAGGVAFTFWLVEHVNPLSCVLVLGGAVLLPLALVQVGYRRSAACRAGLAATGLMLVLAGVAGPGRALDAASIRLRWGGFAAGLELVANHDSKYQNLAVGRLAEQFSLYANGRRITDFPKFWGDYRLATHIALCQHPAPQCVLLLGGGADGVLAEVLRHQSVRQVDYVELDPASLDMIRSHLPQRDLRALADPRVRLHQADARQFVKRADRRYDLILAVLPSPSSAQVARFYTRQFYQELGRILAPDGVYSFQAEASPAELRPESRRYLASLVATLQTVFSDVLVVWGLRPQIFACTKSDVLTVDTEVLVRRFVRHGAVLPQLERDLAASADRAALYRAYFDGSDWLEPAHVAARRDELTSYPDPAIYTDTKPAAYLDWLIWWDKQQRGPSARFFELLGRLEIWQVLLAGLAALAVWQVTPLVLTRGAGALDNAVLLSIATTGLATMAMEIVLLLAFQSLYGYVYQRIGLIIAVFMLGLVLGSGWMNRLLVRRPAGSLGGMVCLDLLLALLAGMIPLVLVGLGRLQAWRAWSPVVELTVYLLGVAAGLLGGLAFPLAAALRLRSGSSSVRVAGLLDAADHGGACIGAVAAGLLLVPVFGLAVACCLLVILKLISAAWLLLAGRLQRSV